MNKLVERFEDDFLDELYIDSVGVDYDIRIVNTYEVAKKIATETKKLAVEFVEYMLTKEIEATCSNDETEKIMNTAYKTLGIIISINAEEDFDKFVDEYYE